MNKVWLFLFFSFIGFKLNGQVTQIAPGEYKSIIIPFYTPNGDYTRSLILLHEASDGTPINANFAIGTLTALRGSTAGWNRLDIAEVKSSSAYNSNSASLTSVFNNANGWRLKTCLFNNKMYLALEVPYNASYHDHGYKFTGWSTSTGEGMLAVPYMVNESPVNQDVLSNIQDFKSNQQETIDVQLFNVLGDVNIGNSLQNSSLAVNGNIRAKEIKVENTNWPDYVFAKSYQLQTLQEIENYIKQKGHLPGIPSAEEVRVNGIDLGEMNAMLLHKIEELTLHLIEKDKMIIDEKKLNANQELRLTNLEEIIKKKLSNN